MAEKHKQPTKEEIEADIIAAQKEIDNPPAPSPSPPEPSTPEPSTPEPSQAEPSPSAPPPTPSPSAPDPSKEELKTRYKHSTREGLVQKAGRDALSKAIKTADGIPEPTEEELMAENPDWDVMSESERKTAKKLMISDRRWEMVNKANKESEDLNEWLKKIEEYSANPSTLVNHPELEGKEEEFRTFAITPSRRGIPVEDLVKVFLFDAIKAKPLKKKGQMFEKPGGGDGGKPPEVDKYSPAEAERLRETNYDGYKQYIKRHRKAITSGNIGE